MKTSDGERGAALTFGLVHGGAHGAWCWERLIGALEALGHRAVAMDLPCEDDAAGAREYADEVERALALVKGPVVLVGHSLGGLTVPIVASERPTRRMIFIAALLPVSGTSLTAQRAAEPGMMLPYSGGRAGLRDRFFNTCTAADADWATARLRRQSRTPFDEVTPLKEWPDVPSSYLVCSEDRAVSPVWGRHAARERLKVEPVELVGSDHSPFLNRPATLAQLIARLAQIDERG